MVFDIRAWVPLTSQWWENYESHKARIDAQDQGKAAELKQDGVKSWQRGSDPHTAGGATARDGYREPIRPKDAVKPGRPTSADLEHQETIGSMRSLAVQLRGYPLF